MNVLYMDEKFLSEVIDFTRDIEPYRVIQVYSGVGSGKNYWIETLAKQGYSILLITSRKATADAQSRKLNGSRWIDLDQLMTLGFGTKRQKKTVVTNAGIEQFLKHKYKPDDEQTHIWKYFDLIVLDEAHSIVSDATFSDSPFHVLCFIRYVQKNASTCRLILMTGTPEPLKPLLSEEIFNTSEYHFLDVYNQCKHVSPQDVYLYPSANIEADILFEIQKGEPHNLLCKQHHANGSHGR